MKTVPSEKGEYENPKKSAYSIEYYDRSWELEHMKELDADSSVAKWTKNHGIRIPYRNMEGKFSTYAPDFLVQLEDGGVELHEIKGTHLLDSEITKRKATAARDWCKAREMNYRLISKYQ